MILIGATVLLSSTAVILLLRRRLIVVAVSGPSMEPTYTDGQRLLACRRSCGSFRAGQVVVIDTSPPSENPGPATNIVKRIVALPGQRVPCAVGGRVSGAVVPPNHIVVLGDNRDLSVDSRQLGFISTHRVVARVVRAMSL
ncbi:S26 family signal peptidase [Nonomuraea sp. NPDC059007]|uniref:S26 family signal peptidase n=1 Tax=Nonomuraea sp. NPDC059007 TaxID=3346692 RepID=UPI0036B9D633